MKLLRLVLWLAFLPALNNLAYGQAIEDDSGWGLEEQSRDTDPAVTDGNAGNESTKTIIDKINQSGIKSGIAINPNTPISKLENYITNIDLICLMGVHAGFGGQKFIEKTFNRLEELKGLINSKKSSALIEIDGGVNENNFERLKTLGADILVAGSYVFNSSDYNAAIDFLK